MGLEHLTFLDREALGCESGDLLQRGAKSNSNFVPLTKQPDKSATHLSYFLRDKTSGPNPITLDDALKRDSNITLFDESILSGKQASTVVQIWFGLNLDLPKEGDLATPLSDDDCERLRRIGVRFRFLYGLPAGIEHLKKVTREAGLGVDVMAFSEEKGLSRSLGSTPNVLELDALRNFLKTVGYDLLVSTKYTTNPTDWPLSLCQERSLGYGNLEQLLVFAYNTPTATLTALWKGGTFRNIPWLPLFPRRGETSPPVKQQD